MRRPPATREEPPMTEHSTDELKRQLDAATSTQDAATQAMYAAARAYAERRCAEVMADLAAQGITPGAIVREVMSYWTGKPVGFAGVEWRYGSVRASLTRVKADGTAGRQSVSASGDLGNPGTKLELITPATPNREA